MKYDVVILETQRLPIIVDAPDEKAAVAEVERLVDQPGHLMALEILSVRPAKEDNSEEDNPLTPEDEQFLKALEAFGDSGRE